MTIVYVCGFSIHGRGAVDRVMQLDQWDQHFREMARLSVELGDDNSEFIAKEVWADGLLGMAEFHRAEQMATEAIAAARRTRNRFNIATGLSVLAGVKLVTGDWEAADKFLVEGLEVAPGEGRLLMLKVMSLTERGMFDEADEYIHRYNENTRRPGFVKAAVGRALLTFALASRLSGQ